MTSLQTAKSASYDYLATLILWCGYSIDSSYAEARQQLQHGCLMSVPRESTQFVLDSEQASKRCRLASKWSCLKI